MSRTRRLTLSAMLVALGVLFLLVGRYAEVLDLALVIAASFLIAFAMLELGGAWPPLVYLSTALLSFLLTGFSFAAFAYLCFGGLYPLLKYPLDRHLPRAPAYVLKLLFANLAIAALMLLSLFLIGLKPRFGTPHLIALAALANAVFLLYDYTLTRLTVRYYISIRPRIARLLK